MVENLLRSALLLSLSALTLLVRQQEGHPACKEVGCWIEGGDNLTGALHVIAPVAPCGLRGCKNGPAPFPGRMSYKATKPGLVCLSYLSMLYYCIVVY